MGENPQNDWKIRDIETVCRAIDLKCSPPSGGGSHYKVSSEHLPGLAMVPAKRPIKAIYIKKFVRFAAEHLAIKLEVKSGD